MLRVKVRGWVLLPCVAAGFSFLSGCGDSMRLAPVSGTVLEVNTALADAPDAISNDPYGAGWLVKVRLAGPADGLMDAAGYRAHLAQ